MAIVKTTEARLELRAVRSKSVRPAVPGEQTVYTNDAALLYTVGGKKVMLRQGGEVIELDAAQLVQLTDATSEILNDINKQ